MNAPTLYSLYQKSSRILIASAATVFALSVANADTPNSTDSTNTDATHQGPSTIAKRMFERLDSDQNNRLDWNELHTTYAAQLDRLDWSQSSVFRNFDRNQNKALDFNEYNDFLTGIRDESLKQKEAATQATNTLITPPADADSATPSIRIAQNDPHYSTLKNQPTEDKPQDNTDIKQQPRRHDYTEEQSNDQRIYRDMRTDGLTSEEPYTEKQTTENPDTQKKSLGNPKMVVVDGKNIETDKVEGANVKNLDNKKVGIVDKVITADNGTAAGLVINVGGTLGLGEKGVFVSISKIKLQGQDIVWQTHMDEKALEKLPTYNDTLISSADY
ncbi:hypothetical protein TDB9533_00673 [Thalassocella blandensis]|nr:hypothetical protein TDB9533_00673 [Thalassocella blandensis]